MASNAFSDMLRLMGQSRKKSIEGVLYHLVVCLRFSSGKIYSAETRKIGIKSHRQILQGPVAAHKNSGKKRGPSRGVIQKCEHHERSPCVPKFEDRTLQDTSQERGASREATGPCEGKGQRPRSAPHRSSGYCWQPLRTSQRSENSW